MGYENDWESWMNDISFPKRMIPHSKKDTFPNSWNLPADDYLALIENNPNKEK